MIVTSWSLWLSFWCLWLGAIDWCSGRLPNYLTYSGTILGLIWHGHNNEFTYSLADYALGFLYPYIVNYCYYFVRSRHGLGQGDIHMIAMISVCLGWPAALMSLIFACILGISAVLLGYVMSLKSWSCCHLARPFGPWLACGVIMTIQLPQHYFDFVKISLR